MSFESLNNAPTNRENLEWLVYHCLVSEEPCISSSRGRELLGFRYMEEMREWRIKFEFTYDKLNRQERSPQ